MISTSSFLDSSFQAYALTCDYLAVPGKLVLFVLHHEVSKNCFCSVICSKNSSLILASNSIKTRNENTVQCKLIA
jgi:hypothetical protein